ncbi:MAG: hypothetical protein CL927_02295 [Deltaproteobacteria bacterium]|nr:hypothetical protein [Deltaproteobacteria bacterium]HCH65307.1 hypothetical protein [Deltaproteobacteria bacterium]
MSVQSLGTVEQGVGAVYRCVHIGGRCRTDLLASALHRRRPARVGSVQVSMAQDAAQAASGQADMSSQE